MFVEPSDPVALAESIPESRRPFRRPGNLRWPWNDHLHLLEKNSPCHSSATHIQRTMPQSLAFVQYSEFPHMEFTSAVVGKLLVEIAFNSGRIPFGPLSASVSANADIFEYNIARM